MWRAGTARPFLLQLESPRGSNPVISLAAYDPRPMEPDWVRYGEQDTPGQLDWQVFTSRWNRETKKYDKLEDCGSSIEELFAVLDHVMINGLDAEVMVDATEMGEPEKMPSPQFCAYYKTKCEDWTGLFHRVTFSDCEEETTSNDDALYFIEAAIYNRERVTMETGPHDPTP